jgi:hypothetical protein
MVSMEVIIYLTVVFQGSFWTVGVRTWTCMP